MRLDRAVERLATAAALLGGVLVLAIVLLNAVSIIGNALLGRPFAGTFELTEVGVAVAVFLFLPYCQLTDANVSADLFTERLPPRTRAGLALLWALVALGIALVLAERTWAGLLDQRAYRLTTTILQLPLWWAFVPVVAALGLLAAACLVTVVRAAVAVRGR